MTRDEARERAGLSAVEKPNPLDEPAFVALKRNVADFMDAAFTVGRQAGCRRSRVSGENGSAH